MIAAMDPAERLLDAAPRALLIMNCDFDSDQPKHYAIEFYRRLLGAYALAPEQLRLAIYPAGHTVTPDMERDAVDWIVGHLLESCSLDCETLAARHMLDGFSCTHFFGKGVQTMRHKQLVVLLSALMLFALLAGACTATVQEPAGAAGAAATTEAAAGATARPALSRAAPPAPAASTRSPHDVNVVYDSAGPQRAEDRGGGRQRLHAAPVRRSCLG